MINENLTTLHEVPAVESEHTKILKEITGLNAVQLLALPRAELREALASIGVNLPETTADLAPSEYETNTPVAWQFRVQNLQGRDGQVN